MTAAEINTLAQEAVNYVPLLTHSVPDSKSLVGHIICDKNKLAVQAICNFHFYFFLRQDKQCANVSNLALVTNSPGKVIGIHPESSRRNISKQPMA